MTDLQGDVKTAPPSDSVVPYAGPGTRTARLADDRRRRFSISKPFIYLLLISYLLIVVYPMVWLLYSSLKPDQQIFLKPFAPPNPANVSGGDIRWAWDSDLTYDYVGYALRYSLTDLEWRNFSNAWTKGSFDRYFFNSILITSTTVIVTTFLAAMAAYALSRFVFPGAKGIYFYFLAGLMIPLQLAIVPLFFQLRGMGLLDNRFGLFLVYLAFGFPFSIFVLTGFFRSLPASLHESALLDGATEFQAFWHVMLPLARPGLITVAIFLFLGNWNEFFVAFMTISGRGGDNIQTLPLGLAKITIVSNYRSDWGMAFAGLVLMMLPTLIAYIFLQKHLTKGITAGAIKG